MAERRECKDSLSLFEMKSWQLVKVGGRMGEGEKRGREGGKERRECRVTK